MTRMTSYDRYGRLMSDFDKSAYGPCWYYEGQPQTAAFADSNEGVKLSANLRRLEEDNANLRELVADMYRRFHGVVIENWSYSSEDFYTYEQRMRELGVEVEP